MKEHFLFTGPAGCGKTHQAIDIFIAKLLEKDLFEDKNAFFLVPSFEHAERVKYMVLDRLPKKGFFRLNDSISNFNLFAQKLLSSKKLDYKMQVSQALQKTFIEEIINENLTKLVYYQAICKKDGFLTIIINLFNELKNSSISFLQFSDAMQKLANTLPEDQKNKYLELSFLFTEYQQLLISNDLCDDSGIALVLEEELKKDPRLASSIELIIIDGFVEFTSAQQKLLATLAKITKKMIVTVTIDKEHKTSQLFGKVQQTVVLLTQLGFQEEYFSTQQRTKSKTLSYLWSNIFTHPKQVDSNEDNALTIIESASIEKEIENIARQIRVQLKNDPTLYFSDCALIFRSLNNQASLIQTIFSKFNIPITIHQKNKLNNNPTIRVIFKLLKIFEDRWQTEDVLAFTKSSLVNPTFVNINEEFKYYVEYYVRKIGLLHGSQAWQTDWKIPQKEDSFDNNRKEFFKTIHSWEERINNCSDHFSLKELFIEILKNFTHPDSAAIENFLSLFDDIGESFKYLKKPFEVKYFLKLLKDAVKLATFSSVDNYKNTVQVYDTVLMRQKEFRCVFIGNLVEGNFPKAIKENPLIKDHLRRIINENGLIHLDEQLPKIVDEKYLFYLAITRAKEKLFFSYPAFNKEGQETTPSFYLKEVKRIINIQENNIIKQDLSNILQELGEPQLKSELCSLILSDFAEEKTSIPKNITKTIETISAYNDFLPELQDLFSSSAPQLFWDNNAILKNQHHIESFFSLNSILSTSKLELFARCPFAYFSRYILRATDIQVEHNAKDFGSIIHSTLYHFFSKTTSKPDLTAENIEELEKIILKCYKKAKAKHPLPVSAPYKTFLDDKRVEKLLCGFLKDEIENSTSLFQPADFELCFGPQPLDNELSPNSKLTEPLTFDFNGHNIRIAGKIDRLDIYQDYALIVDYKSGSAQFTKNKMKDLIDFQLAIYSMAIKKIFDYKIAGAELFSLKNLKHTGFYLEGAAIKKTEAKPIMLSDEEYQKYIDAINGKIKSIIDSLLKAEIPVKPFHSSEDGFRFCKEFCEYRPICRVHNT